ncbi:MAG TPA: hypothetical protein VK636_17590 [Gemmatimonadaceae bacterium]|nr:hypothetical protein [Gemmatimonadaceae bacterium]
MGEVFTHVVHRDVDAPLSLVFALENEDGRVDRPAEGYHALLGLFEVVAFTYDRTALARVIPSKVGTSSHKA